MFKTPPRSLTRLLLAVLLAAGAGGAYAEQPRHRPGLHRPDGAGGGRMTWEDRQRLREDLRRNDAPDRLRDERRDERRERFERMTPEERQRLREDLRNFERRR